MASRGPGAAVSRPSERATNPLAQQAERSQRLRDPWRPNWIDVELPGWPTATIKWAEATPDAVDETRNRYLHAEYLHTTFDGEFVPIRLDHAVHSASEVELVQSRPVDRASRHVGALVTD